MKKVVALLCAVQLLLPSAFAQSSSLLKKSWKTVAKTKDLSWYSSAEALLVANNVLQLQDASGGWPKNINMHHPISQELRTKMQQHHKDLAPTIDNGATIAEMHFVAQMFRATSEERFRASFRQAMNYLLEAQYPNGGWPQFYPLKKGYYSHITYNDNAMVNVMNLLKEVAEVHSLFQPLADSALRARSRQAFDKGVECLLKTQIRIEGRPTVWCAQHDENTLLPVNARAYELASFSGSESASIVLLLMELENPSDAVVASIQGAVSWFRDHAIHGWRMDNIINSDGKKDRVMVQDASAPSLWARFYDLTTGEPFFCDRDGIPVRSIAELGFERRVGYSWYTTTPQKVLDRFTKWNARFGHQRVTLYSIGDSTMSLKDTSKGNPERGWMMAFESLTDTSRLAIRNVAKNGRSSKSFRTEGIWEGVMQNLSKGDYVFIQFGHNDSKKDDTVRFTAPYTEFRDNLVRYIRQTRSKGATPVLFTSIARRSFDDNGQLIDTHGDYVTVTRQVAKEENVMLIDLNTMSTDLLQKAGVEPSTQYFKYLEPNTNPHFPKGFKDNTHLNKKGAEAIARLVKAELQKQKSPLCQFLK